MSTPSWIGNWNDTTTLAQVGGYALTRGHIEVGLSLIRLLIEGEVTEEEREALRERSIVEFQQAPEAFDREIRQLAGSLAQVGQLSSPVDIGLARQALFAAIYGGLQALPREQWPMLMQIVLRYVRVRAFDGDNGLVLTDRDVAGVISYAAFLRMLAGDSTEVDASAREQVERELVEAFPGMGLEHKRMVCSAALLWKTIEANWARFDDAQRAQLKAQYRESMAPPAPAEARPEPGAGPAWAEGSGTPSSGTGINQATWDIMMDMQLNSHVTALNIIESIGGSSNYWEVVY